MSKAFPLTVKKNKTGRPPKEGEREANGRLKRDKDGRRIAENATRETVAHHRALELDYGALYEVALQDPLDAALARGWLTINEHSAGRLFASLFRHSQRGGGSAQRMGVDLEGALIFSEPERPLTRDEDRCDWSIRDLPDAEIEALWDSTFDELPPAQDDREPARRCSDMCDCSVRAAVLCLKWHAVNAALSIAERREVYNVCVLGAWPRWLAQRCAGKVVSERAAAEGRELTAEEAAFVARKLLPGLERRRELLRCALGVISEAAKAAGGQVPPTPPAVILEPEPAPYRPISPARIIGPEGLINYIDQDGEPWFVVERRRGR